MQAPVALEAATRPNLERALKDMVEEGEEIVVTDSKLPLHLCICICYSTR